MIFFAFSAPLFWYKLVFFTELLIAEVLATYTLSKKKKFALRLSLSVLIGYLIVFLIPIADGSNIWKTIYNVFLFLAMFGLSIGVMAVCFEEKLSTLFFSGVIAYTVQHLSYSTYDYLVSATGVGSYNIYGTMEIVTESNVLLMSIIYVIVYGLIYWAVWAFLEHKLREQDKLRIDPILILTFSGILFVDVVLSDIVTYFMTDITLVGKSVIYFYRLMSCLFIYVVLYSTLMKHQAQYEAEKVEMLWSEDKKRYELTKKNIEAINIKCHDLKHQIRKLKENKEVIDENYLKELESKITIYDNTVRTGNDALDLILTENSINMAQEGISFSVIADGSLLSFMSHSDVYSLFGNAISNAREAVESIEDREKRIISLHVYQEGKMVAIHVENPSPDVRFDIDGFPITSKENKNEHGFGMRSMKMIAEKYSGFLNMSHEDGFFYLDILLPNHR